MAKILVVDDEPSILLAVRDELEFEGFDVETAGDGESAIALVESFRPDVMLLDLMLPDTNGFEVCREVRSRRKDMWIIMLTVRSAEADRVRGLDTGADDYVTKPFSLRELVARINVGLRRSHSQETGAVISFGDIQVDFKARKVSRSGQEIDLTAREFDILRLMLEHAGEVLTRDFFLDEIWGNEVVVVPRVIDTHIASLRKKLEDNPDHPVYIRSVRGVGYRLDVESIEETPES